MYVRGGKFPWVVCSYFEQTAYITPCLRILFLQSQGTDNANQGTYQYI